MRVWMVGIGLALALGMPAQAMHRRSNDWKSPSDMIADCRVHTGADKLECELTVQVGVAIKAVEDENGRRACPPSIPADMTEAEGDLFRRGRIVEPVLKWIEAHPKALHGDWLAALDASAHDLWPCS
ncbi:MAG TPA: hypothetical protein VF138_03265 [Caulobacteraceae bacterium]